jgi:hypothetical protein
MAYRRAGSPPQSSPALGSFAQWSREVRDALLWIGKPDPVATQADIRAVDRKRGSHERLMATWFEAAERSDANATRGMIAKRLVELACELRTENGMPNGWQRILNPSVGVEKTSRVALMAALKQIGFEGANNYAQ